MERLDVVVTPREVVALARRIAAFRGYPGIGPKTVLLAFIKVAPALVREMLSIKDLGPEGEEPLAGDADDQGLELGWTDEGTKTRISARLNELVLQGFDRAAAFLVATIENADSELKSYLDQIACPAQQRMSDYLARREGATPSASPASPSSVVTALDELRRRLEDKVFGQTAALRAFADALETSLLKPARRAQLRGSFMVFGPHGCGKSEMLRVLADWVQERREVLPIKRVVSCEGYLFSALQSLRQQIEGQPSGILILGEFEKYERTFHDVLLEGLSRAELVLPEQVAPGKLSRTKIDGWIIILSGNVGRRFWQRLPYKEKDILPGAEQIREALEEEVIQDRHRKSDFFASALDRSLVDRIETFIPFCQLRYADISRILDREIDRLATELSSDVTLEVDARVRELIVLHAMYKKTWSARQVLRSYVENIERPVRSIRARTGASVVRCQSSDSGFNGTMKRSQPRLVVVDDEHTMVTPAITAALVGQAAVEGTDDIRVAIQISCKEPCDLLLLDMYFSGEPRWREYLATWRAALPDVPVALFSSRPPSAADRMEIDRLGGVIGFVAKHSDHERTRAALVPMLAHAAWQARVRSFEQHYGHGGDQVLFDVAAATRESRPDALVIYSNVASVVSSGRVEAAATPVLPPASREEIDEFLQLFLDAPRRARLGVRRPRGILLHGPPGNGKTMVARDLAQRMRCNFLVMSAGDFQSKWAGVASERIRELFDKARLRQPCVVFIDEIDALAPRRTEGTGGGVERDQNNAVATLLTHLDGFDDDGDVFVIGATNRKDAIDEAVLRPGRLERHIEIRRPGVAERKELLARLLVARGAEFDAIWAARETYGLCAADVVRALDDAVLIASRRGQGAASAPLAVTQADFRDAVDQVRYGRKPEAADGEWVRAERERTAWHEAGHLVLEMALFKTVPERVSIVPRGEIGGFVRVSEEDFTRKLRQMRRSTGIQEIAVLVGGGLAEERKFGEHGSGVAGDRRQALRLAHEMVTVWGMGSLEAAAEAVVAATGAKSKVAEEVAGVLREAEQVARATLDANAAAVGRAAELLLEKEDVDAVTIREAFADVLSR